MKRLFGLFALSVLLMSSAARAEIQKTGPEVWPGKVMLGARPAGVGLTLYSPVGAIYKVGIDFAGPHWGAKPWRFRIEPRHPVD